MARPKRDNGKILCNIPLLRCQPSVIHFSTSAARPHKADSLCFVAFVLPFLDLHPHLITHDRLEWLHASAKKPLISLVASWHVRSSCGKTPFFLMSYHLKKAIVSAIFAALFMAHFGHVEEVYYIAFLPSGNMFLTEPFLLQKREANWNGTLFHTYYIQKVLSSLVWPLSCLRIPQHSAPSFKLLIYHTFIGLIGSSWLR